MPSAAAVREAIAGPAIAVDEGCRYLAFPREGDVVARTWVRGPVTGPRDDEAINVPQAEQLFPGLLPIGVALRRRFAAPVNLQLFAARRGAGLRVHSDLHDSFIVQIEGRKRWRIEDPKDPQGGALRPRGNSGGCFGEAARTVVLEPGDVLYKPSHGLHATVCESEESLSLTASIVTTTAAAALLRWVEAATLFDPAWRIPLPATEGDVTRLWAALEELPGLLPSVEGLLAGARAPDEEDDEGDEEDDVR